MLKDRFISKRYWEDKATPMGKVDELARLYDDCIDLSIGDPDTITDVSIIESAFDDAKKGHTKYTESRGDRELRQEIAKMYKEDYDVTVADEEIFIVTGGLVGMYLALETILDDGDEVIIPAPYFTPYIQQVELARGIPVVLDTFEDQGFQINPERLKSLITKRTKAIIFNTPNNPTGKCQSKETLEAMAQIVKEHDLIVIADDIYPAYSFAEPFIPFMSLPDMKERTITINSSSKDFAMTGWRVGNVIAPEKIIDTMKIINENVVFTAPSISQRAYLHAIRSRKQVQPPLIAEYKKRLTYAAERINNIQWLSTTPTGTFYLWVNIKETGLTSEKACMEILQQAHIVTIPGSAFGACGEGYLRLACTVNVDTLKEAFDRLEKMKF